MTEQDFMPRHFIQLSMDGTEAVANSDVPSVEGVRVSESVSEIGATCLHVSETSAGAPECPVDQVGQCLVWPPLPRNPFSETHRLLQRTLLTFMKMVRTLTFPPVVRSYIKVWLNWKVRWLRRTEK